MKLRELLNESIEEEGLNLTPLIDVVFVVLVTFILVAPFLAVEKIDLTTTTQKLSTTKAEPKAIAITLAPQNQLLVDGNPLKLEQLSSYLKVVYQNTPDASIQIFPDENSKFGMFQMVKDQLASAGFKQVEVVLRPNG